MINDDMPPTGMQTPDQLNLKVDDADYYLSHHQPRADHTLFYYKTSHCLPRAETLGF